MAKNKKDLSKGNIKKQLFELTWPMFLGMMGMVIFNLVDTYFVGKLGVKQLAAMSFSFPVIMFLNSLSQGIGIGTSSLISRNIIKEDRSKIKMMASRAILLGLLVVLTFMALGFKTSQSVFYALGARNEILNYVNDYMNIWYLGFPFVVIPMIGNNIVRATGDTFTPGMLMVSSGIVNIILDPLLIFGLGPFPEMGIKGAGLATVIARSTSLIFILIVLIKREKLLSIYLGKAKDILTTWKNVLHIATPATLTNLITPISIAIITKIFAGYGKEAVAAFGVASRIEMFALMVIVSLSSVLIIFIGQNISIGNSKRVLKSLNISVRFSIIWGCLFFLLIILFGKTIASVFTDDLQVIDVTRRYLLIMGGSYGFQGMLILSSSSFNGINNPYPSMIFSIIRMFVLYIPLAIISSKFLGLNGIFWAGFVANTIIGISSYKFLVSKINKISSAPNKY